MVMPVVENSQKLPESQKADLLSRLSQLIDEAKSLDISDNSNDLAVEASEYQIEKIFEVETIYAHLVLASYLESEKVRGKLALSVATEPQISEVLRNLYSNEDLLNQARKCFYDLLYICLDWLYQSIKWFCALKIPDNCREDLRSCRRQLLECAFEILTNKAKEWTDNAQVATEVRIYLNLLIKQIY
jgi:hypothetical protein